VGNATGHERKLRFDRETLGQREPWEVVHRGIAYAGEVVAAEAVDADLGLPLEGDVCFRVVFYTVPRRIPVSQIRDPRIAMAVPRRSGDLERERVTRELRAIREARELYVAAADPEANAMRSGMQEREDSLRSEMGRRQALNYSQGRIYTQDGVILRPAEAFADESAATWVERLVGDLFDKAFPTLPLEHDLLPDTLTPERIQAVFRGIFNGASEAAGTAGAFGPALGLSSPDSPTAFDGGNCQVIGIIERELASRGGAMGAEVILGLLCREHGLNRALATLYLLAFMRHTRAGLDLRPEHSLRLRQGGSGLSNQITWYLVTDLAFSVTMADQFGVLRAQPALTWNVALPYTSLVVDGLEAAHDEADTAVQERRLLRGLGELGSRLERSRGNVGELDASPEEGDKSSFSQLNKLQVLCAATGYRSFHTMAVDSFDSPSGLARVLGLYDRLENLATLVPAITRVKAYLSEMTFGRNFLELSLKRDALAARTGIDTLLGNPGLWGSLEEGFEQLRREHASTYILHHDRYHQEAVELTATLDRLRRQVEALARFNDIPELDGPLATDMPRRFWDITGALRTCGQTEEDLSLDDAPFCQECRLPLGECIPRREVASVVHGTEGAMREYNRRLSSEGVRRILAHPNRAQHDKLIGLIQVSDLTNLANVLDEEVVDFLRGLIRS